ncbi:ABC transporter substrate-binding protein [Aureimonas flava]|uniref:ABC transporter substrate-binding protein n=1 Tax=Aureimonas flava TaxID=2320271 RepID=A0A3A1WNB6_9HYPH|nr:ABC transporter substrate-binding protein [Aureimonas flava]RIY02569.1 ABC transporter substrate-binding protein [Aureimonas flava]
MFGTENGNTVNLRRQLADKAISRREFVRLAALLGASATAAYAFAGLPAYAQEAENLPFPPRDPKAQAGGILRFGQKVAKMDDPHVYSWNEMSNQSRPVIEYLTLVGPDNVTRGMLVESWQPSEDLKTWTLNVRKGVKWHNGDDFTAEHVAWNIRRWTDSDTGSAILGLSTFSALAQETGGTDAKGKPARKAPEGAIEVVDTHTLRLHLSKPVLSLPEDCGDYPCLVIHPSFQAPFSDNPIGTGPYTVKELKVGERCVLTRIHKTTTGEDFTYWGGDVYLDEIHFLDYDQESQTLALASGSVDAIYELTSDQLELAKGIEGAQIGVTSSAGTLCMRMQVDQKPFDDIRVRQAICKAADNGQTTTLLFPEGGKLGANFHVAPIHPEFFELPPQRRDVEGARALLAEAGYPDGLDLSIDVGNTDGPWQQATCEALRNQLADAGIRVAVNVMPSTKFWEVWMDTPFGATSWGHRPLGTMVLSQAYRTGAPWNETHYSNPEFDAALDAAEATIDVAERRRLMEKVETILRDDALMVQPFWRPIYILASATVHGYQPHPARQSQLTRVWMG